MRKRSIVNAEYAVLDPQNVTRTEAFGAYGSKRPAPDTRAESNQGKEPA